MTRILTAALLLALVTSVRAEEDGAYQALALSIMTERPSCDPSWFGGTVEQCDRALSRIAELRVKYDKQGPPKLRRAILDWLDYFERQAREYREDCVTGKGRKDQDEYEAKMKRDQDRVQKLRETLSKEGYISP
jgi:hypothetical protein